jgi:hypothetical protein
MENERLISVQDVYNVIREHLAALDNLWPEDQRYGPRRVTIIELIEGIKLRLIQRAEKNANQYVSPLQKAAQKALGFADKPITARAEIAPVNPQISESEKAAMEAKARISEKNRF